MRTVPLRHAADFIRGITFKPSDIISLESDDAVACMRTKNVQSELDTTDVLAVPRKLIKRKEQFLKQGDILVSSANSWNLVGKCSWVPNLEWPATLGGFISALRTKEGIDNRYIYHWFSFGKTQELVRSCARQTTNIANLSFDQCLDLEIPLPPLDEQKRIAAILDQADSLRRARRRSIEKLNTLAQSIFYEMFGDPSVNPKDLAVKKLSEVGELDRGVSKHRPRNDPTLLGGSHPLIQTGDVSNADGYIRTFTNTYSDIGLRQSRMWKRGTLCITIAANIGKTAILDFDACFPDSVVGFKPQPCITTEYVQYWFQFIQKKLEDDAPQSAQKNINLSILRDLIIPVPDINEVNRFSSYVQIIEERKQEYRIAAEKMETLFSSLQYRAFRGEL